MKKTTCLWGKELHKESSVIGKSDWKENAEHLVVDKWEKEGKVTGGQLRMLLFNSEIRERKIFALIGERI